jgi:uroporphyrinogen-III synthase
MAVLVTRPGEQGLNLCRRLSHIGIVSYHLPLIEIQLSQRLDGLGKQMKTVDIILAVSQHAVAAVDNYLRDQEEHWPTKVYFAIGQKTAHTLSIASQQKVHCPEINDSEHLLALPQLNNITNQNVLILRGNGGRELIDQTLTQRGASVEYYQVYRRQKLAFDVDRLIPIWKENNVSQLVVTSKEQLDHFISQITADQRKWLYKQHLYVPSERIAKLAYQYGFTTITTTYGASNSALLAALQPS